MRFVFSDAHEGHDPLFSIVRGEVRHSAEQPERARVLKAAAECAGLVPVPAASHGRAPSWRCTAPDYLASSRARPARLEGARRRRDGGRGEHASAAACRHLSALDRRSCRLAHGRRRLPDRAAHLRGGHGRRPTSRSRAALVLAGERQPMRSAGRPAITPMPTWPAASASSTTPRSPRSICAAAGARRRARHRRPSRQRHPGHLLGAADISPSRSMPIPTTTIPSSGATPTSGASAPGPAPISTCRCRSAAWMRAGSRRSTRRWPRSMHSRRRRWWWRWALTLTRAIP